MNFVRNLVLIVCAATAMSLAAQSPVGQLLQLDVENYDEALEYEIAGYLRNLDAEGRPAVERELLAVALDSSAPLGGRRLACRLLLLCPSDQSVTALAPLLVDPDMAHYARAVIEAVPGELANVVLVDALELTTGPLWVGVVDSLGVRRCVSAVEALAAAASDEDSVAAAVAIRALGAIGDLRSFAALNHLEVEGALEELRVHSLLKAGQHLIKTDEYVAAVAAEMEQLVVASQPPVVRLAAYRLLVRAQPENAPGIIAGLLGSDEEASHSIGANLLDLVGSDGNLDNVLARWEEYPADARTRVLTILTTQGRREVLAVARETTEDENRETRINAVKAIGRFGSSKDVSQLYKLAAEGGAIEEAAIGALASLPEADIDLMLIREFERKKSSIRSQLTNVFAARHTVAALPVLLEAGNEATGRFAANVYRAVGSLGGADLVPVLLSRRTETEASSRLAIERAIIGIGRRLDDGQVVGMITATWSDTDESLNESIIRMVGAIGDSAALDFLTPLVAEANPRPVALNAVNRWTSHDVLPVLKGVVVREDLSESDRRSAWQAILRLTLEFGWQDRMYQVEWAGFLMDSAINTDDRRRAIDAFGQLQRYEFIEFLGQWTEDPELGEAARVAQESVRKLTED